MKHAWVRIGIFKARVPILYRAVLLVILTCGAVGCQQGVPDPIKITDLPPNSLNNTIVWLPSGQFVIDSRFTLLTYTSGDSDWQPLKPTNDPICHGLGYFNPTALPDGRIGFVCTADPSKQRTYETIVAYDLASDTIARLTDYLLPETGQYTWKHDLSRGMLATSGEYRTLYWLTNTELQPTPILLKKASKAWFMPDSIRAFEQFLQSPQQSHRSPRSVGLVRDPAWAPNDTSIAFWATLEPIGTSDPLPVVSWDLYLTKPNDTRVERILEDITDPALLMWSPDSRWLLYISGPQGTTQQGLWIFNLSTRTTNLIAKGNINAAAWSPDGKSVVGVVCRDSLCKQAELWQYDLSSKLNTSDN